MSDPFIGQIAMFAGNFTPRGWQLCNGQLLEIAQNQALFSIIGTTYGGDGRTTFAVPDLRGRVPVHCGQGPGMLARQLGENGGQEAVALTVREIPSHAHTAIASSRKGEELSPEEMVCARATEEIGLYSREPDVRMHEETVQPTGGSQPHENMPPYMCINFIIATQGVYPPRP